MNRAYLRILAIAFLVGLFWLHYFVMKIFKPDVEAIAFSYMLIFIGIIRTYYALKKEI